MKTIINRVLCIKDSHSCGSRYIGETNCNMQMLDGMNIITQIKIRNHGNTFETISTNVLKGLLFEMLQKMLKQGII